MPLTIFLFFSFVSTGVVRQQYSLIFVGSFQMKHLNSNYKFEAFDLGKAYSLPRFSAFICSIAKCNFQLHSSSSLGYYQQLAHNTCWKASVQPRNICTQEEVMENTRPFDNSLVFHAGLNPSRSVEKVASYSFRALKEKPPFFTLSVVTCKITTLFPLSSQKSKSEYWRCATWRYGG